MGWVIVLWIVSFVCTGLLSYRKHRDMDMWLIAAMACGPLSVLLLLFLGEGSNEVPHRSERQCSACFSYIPTAATRCRYCTEVFTIQGGQADG